MTLVLLRDVSSSLAVKPNEKSELPSVQDDSLLDAWAQAQLDALNRTNREKESWISRSQTFYGLAMTEEMSAGRLNAAVHSAVLSPAGEEETFTFNSDQVKKWRRTKSP